MPKVKGQENQRYTDIFVDQTGREYLANCEKSTNDPVDLGVYNWKAPLEPAWARNLFLPPTDDRDVVKMVPRVERNRRGFQVFIDYDAWLLKVDTSATARRERMFAIAQESFKGAELLKIMDGHPPAELLRYVGPEPMPPREVILAMRAGNEWALGLSDKIPDLALALLERIRPSVESMRSITIGDHRIVDPFAATGSGAPEEDDEEEVRPVVEDPFGPGGAARTADELADLEEQYDPAATGGTLAKPLRRRMARTAE